MQAAQSIRTFEDAERFVRNAYGPIDPEEIATEVTDNLRNYLSGIGIDEENLYRHLPSQSQIIVGYLCGYRTPDGRIAKILGKYDPFTPGNIYIDPEALRDEETAAEVFTDEETHKWQHFSGAMNRYLSGLKKDAAIAYLEGAAAAVTEDVTGNSDAHPAAKELYRMLEKAVGKYDALTGSDRALKVARELWNKYSERVYREEPLVA